jgi:hypothetical protein
LLLLDWTSCGVCGQYPAESAGYCRLSTLFPRYGWLINCQEWKVDIAVSFSAAYPGTLKVLAPLNVNVNEPLYNACIRRVVVFFFFNDQKPNYIICLPS